MVFYGLSLNTSNINGNKYLNCFFSAFIDIIAYMAAWLFANRVTRPTLLFCSMMLSGVVLMVIQLIPEGVGSLSLLFTYRETLPGRGWSPLLLLFFRHADHAAGVHPGGKDRRRWCFLLYLCVLHWALSHRGEEHGLRGCLHSRTHGQHHMSFYHLHRQVLLVICYCELLFREDSLYAQILGIQGDSIVSNYPVLPLIP